jgi:sugar lactone lactonase YvrE
MKLKFVLGTAVVLCCTFSCIKKPAAFNFGKTVPGSGPVTITGISPTHGAAGTSVTISGTGFSATSTNDIVKINGVLTQVSSAAENSLVVSIPVKAGTGAITVTIGGQTVTGPVLTYDPAYIVSTFVGSSAGFADGTGQNAQFKRPYGICVDADGNLYVADAGNYKIRKISATGVVTTLAGSTQGFTDGSATTAQFKGVVGIARDAQGTLFITDQSAHAIRQLTTAGNVTTIAGGIEGYSGGSVTAAQFDYPAGICTDAAGTPYLADASNSLIRMVYSGYVYNIAGTPCQTGFADGYGSQALFNDPLGICTDGQGNFYVADTYGQRIRKVTAGGLVTTIAGSQRQGTADGTGTDATFFQPSAICIDSNGNLYVADTQNHLIRKVTPSGVVTTIAGTSHAGKADGAGTAASFNTPFGICVDAQGTLYVSDTYNNTIRKIVQE